MNIPIQTQALHKSFGEVRAVDGLDLAVPAGSIYGLIGRNGAGKTTAIRLLMGLLRADSGSTAVLGHNLWTAPRPVKARITYVSQTQQLHNWMSLAELSYYLSHFYDRWSPPKVAQLSRLFEIPADRPVGTLSGGQQRLAAIILALAAQPDVLILDEPAAGLDPIARRRLIEQLIEFIGEGRGQRTVLFSTHILSDLERVADHVGFMDGGRMLAQGKLEDFQSRTRRVQIVFDTPAAPPGFTIPGAVRMKVEGPVVSAIVRAADEADFEKLLLMPDARVNLFPLGLEELFIELLGPEAKVEITEEQAA